MNSDTQALIFIVDDDQAMRDSLSDYFYRANYTVKAYSGGKTMLSELNSHPVEAIICDLKMPQMDGMAVLKELQSREKSPPLIMITAHGNISTAVEAIKHGAYNFIAKPFSPQNLQQMVSQAIDKYRLDSAPEDSKTHPLGSSATIQTFYTQLYSYAKTADNILLTGERGVGKPLVAKTLHQHSQRGAKPFIRINCKIVSERFFEKTFLEDDNAFSRAEEGTIFLENLDKLPLESRAKLLELLTNKVSVKIHQSNHTLPRFIYSVSEKPAKEKAHTNLSKLCALLNGKILQVPALRAHKEDIFELFNLYMTQSAGHYQTPIPNLSEQDIITLSSFEWPGNQHQLKQIAEQFVLLNRTVDTSISHLLKVSSTEMVDMTNKFDKDLRTLMQSFERQLITQAMIECAGNISQVCELLKTPRRTLNEKLLKYDISRSEFLQN